jgi:hypothetical protein
MKLKVGMQLYNVQCVSSPYRLMFYWLILMFFPQRVGVARKNEQYLPAWQSGPYAILLTLLEESRKPNYPGNYTCLSIYLLLSKVTILQREGGKADSNMEFT